MVDQARLLAAYDKVRRDLLAEQLPDGHWIGEVSASAFSTAAAVSALTLVERHEPTDARSGRFVDERRESRLSESVFAGLRWLAENQNEDGGWGDTDRSHSNVATTMLVVAAFHLTGVPADRANLLERAEQFVKSRGSVAALRRQYGKDKTLAVPILANCAFAGIVPWKEVAALPFERACLGRGMYGAARLPVVSYAVPTLIAVGQARYFRRAPRNPLVRFRRSAAVDPSLDLLHQNMPESGGFLESVPLTSFVIMSLAGTGRATHPVVQRGVDFLLDSARSNGSWPIHVDLATRNTTLSANALATIDDGNWWHAIQCLPWLLDCQHHRTDPVTGAPPGGWGWSDSNGAIPNADDTAGALLALDRWRRCVPCHDQESHEISDAARRGANWLLALQNADGGWPTFCRGGERRPFDPSDPDRTAHALRAIYAWRDQLGAKDVSRAMSNGLEYVAGQQNDDGTWMPNGFAGRERPDQSNPVYGTARVLLAYRDLGWLDADVPRKAIAWLQSSQNADGGWGPRRGGKNMTTETSILSRVEESAVAVEALLPQHDRPPVRASIDRGLDWLVRAVEAGRHREAAPIGICVADLWFYEKLYPFIFMTSALGEAVRRLVPSADQPPDRIPVTAVDPLVR